MHPEVETAVASYLAALHEAFDSLVHGVYVVGSAVGGDYRPGSSAVEFVCVTSRTPSLDDVSRLTTLHKGMPRQPHLNGIYIAADELDAPPTREVVIPNAFNGIFFADHPSCLVTPMLWLDLERNGVTVDGVPKTELGLTVPLDQFRPYSAEVMKNYWTPLVTHSKTDLEKSDPGKPVGAHMVGWLTLSLCRLRYSYEELSIANKMDAAKWAALRYPDYASLLSKVMRWRSDGVAFAGAFAVTDALSAVGFAESVITETLTEHCD